MIYLDNAGTTQPLSECVEIFEKYQKDLYFNPSAPYHPALELSKQIKESRESILKKICGTGKIIFTSSGSEADNLALFGSIKSKNSEIIISESEHPAVYNSAMELKQRGYNVKICPVDNTGRVIEDEFIKLISEKTGLISIMHVNNETGCVNDIKNLSKIAKKINKNIIFHSDGVQALGKVPVRMRDLGVDLYTLSAHKIHGIKGIAALYVKEGINIRPLIFGGGQEFGLRSSTENVGGIISFAKAVEIAVDNFEKNALKVSEMRNDLARYFNEIGFRVVESKEQSPYILCAAMPKVRGEVMLHSLEKYDICIGTGSACSSKKSTKKLPSVLKLLPEYEKGIIRISFSRNNDKSEIDYFKNCIKKEYDELLKYIN